MTPAALRAQLEELQVLFTSLHAAVKEIEQEITDGGNKFRLINLCARTRHDIALIRARLNEFKRNL